MPSRRPVLNPLDCLHNTLVDAGQGERPRRIVCGGCGTPLHLLQDQTDEPTLFN